MSQELAKLFGLKTLDLPVGASSSDTQLSKNYAVETHTFRAYRVGEIHQYDLAATKTAVKACFEVGIDPQWIAKGLENHGYKTQEDQIIQPIMPQGDRTSAIREDDQTIMVYNIRSESKNLLNSGEEKTSMIVFSSTAMIDATNPQVQDEKIVDFYAFSEQPLDVQSSNTLTELPAHKSTVVGSSEPLKDTETTSLNDIPKNTGPFPDQVNPFFSQPVNFLRSDLKEE